MTTRNDRQHMNDTGAFAAALSVAARAVGCILILIGGRLLLSSP
jgi:hypothetical protein